jgi:hypothetical protein
MPDVRLALVLQDGAYARLLAKQAISAVEFAVSVPGARQSDRQLGRSLSAILDAPLPGGIDTLRIIMASSARREGNLERSTAMEIVNGLRGLGADVYTLLVRARDAERGKAEEIDLLKDRLQVDVPMSLGADRRFAQRDRWDALRRQYEEWREAGVLPI